ncbi:MAG: hypothetical protein BM557_04370 [Flavobacterium sp. MedPE-SWcel]|nr:MAG: hypothetical protein BM557_04370 [Flavobacterium sp. MedPE-SWcel]
MDLIPEITIVSLLLIGILFYVFVTPKYKKKKIKLLAKYRRARSRSLHYQNKLNSYIVKYDAQNEISSSGITYGELLKDLKRHHSAYLSEKRYRKLKRNHISINRNERVLAAQEKRLKETEEKIAPLI